MMPEQSILRHIVAMGGGGWSVLHFIGEPKATQQRNRLNKIVSSRSTAMAYYLEVIEGEVKENPLQPLYLGD